VRQVDWVEQQVRVALARELVESAPEYDSSRQISREYELTLYKHYGKTFAA